MRPPHPAPAVVAFEGPFAGRIHGADLQATVADLVARRRAEVVLDLRDVTLMDSAGLGLLIEAATSLRAVGGDLRIVARDPRVRALFLMTGLLGRVFALYATVAEAVESYATDVETRAALHSAAVAA